MLLVIQREKGKKILDGYFNTISNTGYVKHPTVERFLIWLFLVDFVELVYSCLTDEDYNLINKALSCLFNGGSCLLPYNALENAVKDSFIADSQHMHTFNVRETEDERWRIVEGGDIRITED